MAANEATTKGSSDGEQQVCEDIYLKSVLPRVPSVVSGTIAVWGLGEGPAVEIEKQQPARRLENFGGRKEGSQKPLLWTLSWSPIGWHWGPAQHPDWPQAHS